MSEPMKTMFKNDLDKAIKNYKTVHMKPRDQCTIPELRKKEESSRYLSYSFTLLLLLVLGIICELYIRGKTSIIFNSLLILCAIALWDEMNSRYNLLLFIKLKELEEKIYETKSKEISRFS